MRADTHKVMRLCALEWGAETSLGMWCYEENWQYLFGLKMSASWCPLCPVWREGVREREGERGREGGMEEEDRRQCRHLSILIVEAAATVDVGSRLFTWTDLA